MLFRDKMGTSGLEMLIPSFHLYYGLLIIVGCFLCEGFKLGAVSCELTPTNDTLLPFNSNDILTYDCEVDSMAGLFWTLENNTLPNIKFVNRQLLDDRTRAIVANRYGITVEDQQVNKSRLTVNVTHFIESDFRDVFGNQLVIGCQVIGEREPFPNASIFFYGPLNKPSNIEFTSMKVSESTFNLSWTGTSVPRVIEVVNFIQVTNLTTNDSQPLELNTTQNYITFNKTGACNEFRLTVTSFNEQLGYSDEGITFQTIPISPDVLPISKSFNNYTVKFQSTTVSLAITFNPATICMAEIPVVNYTVILLQEEEEEEYTLPILSFDDNQIQAVINDTVIPGLSMDQAVDYYVEACSNVTCRATSTFTAYTTGVQLPTVYYVQQNTYVLVVCDFAGGSTASGCSFNFTFVTANGEERNELYNISRSSKVNSTLCNGGSQACLCINGTERFVESYSTIEAFTLEEDGSNSSIAVPAILEELLVNSDRISVCSPLEPLTEPVKPVKDVTTTAVVGGVLGFIVAVLLVLMTACFIYLHKKKGSGTETSIMMGDVINQVSRVLSVNLGHFPRIDCKNDTRTPPENDEITIKVKIIDPNLDTGEFKLEISKSDRDYILDQCGLICATKRQKSNNGHNASPDPAGHTCTTMNNDSMK